MIIKSEVEFNPSEINELFDNIIGIVAKVKLGMDVKSKINEERSKKYAVEDKLQKEREQYDQRIKEMQEDHMAEIKALKVEIEKLKSNKKEEKKNAAAK